MTGPTAPGRIATDTDVTPRSSAAVGAVFGLLAVAAGAFGAHSLKTLLDPDRLAIFETAARYQMYHALALVCCGLAERQLGGRACRAAAWAFLAGILLFSGSLYALAFSGQRWLGALTPLGGLAFLIGWGLLAWGCWKGRSAAD